MSVATRTQRDAIRGMLANLKMPGSLEVARIELYPYPPMSNEAQSRPVSPLLPYVTIKTKRCQMAFVASGRTTVRDCRKACNRFC